MAKSKKKNKKCLVGFLAGVVSGMLGLIVVNYLIDLYLLSQ